MPFKDDDNWAKGLIIEGIAVQPSSWGHPYHHPDVQYLCNLETIQNIKVSWHFHIRQQRVMFTSNMKNPMWRFCARCLFLFSGFCMRDTNMFLSPSFSEYPPQILKRHCGLVQKLSRKQIKNMVYLLYTENKSSKMNLKVRLVK